MDKMDLEQYIIQFFEANQCEVTVEEEGVIHVQLTKEMDKAFMNRPFYWQYIESTGNIGKPHRLSFVTDPDKSLTNREWLHFGSPRLQQMMNYLQKTSRFIHLFEVVEVNKNTLLQPWLMMNYCIEYKGKQVKEEIFSIGLNLINGILISGMMERLERIKLSPVISNHCYTISPLIKLRSGYLRIEKFLHDYVTSLDHKWAYDSIQLLKEELAMIDHFYEHEDNELEKNKEMHDVMKRLQPNITYTVINGGLIYLTELFAKRENPLLTVM